ncbi:PucR family transcriptional regulator [Amycolatopsis aidingensis]|uniref:PucR family transcriptional regulator n=1 Tax=Amycolatopsis aidingensis TaxID=2842453 RepID=UPI0022B62696|nr:helix-turn-helix domain-containing protein [Amycolatopsis aidingensis]
MSTSRIRVPEVLTVAELVRYGPLGKARALVQGNLDQQVSAVTLVGELDQVRQCQPNAAVVVHHAAAHGIWAVESALRLAWERTASCVVAPAGVAETRSTVLLAERLRLPLFVVDQDPAGYALELAAAIASPEAARAQLTSRCAVLFGERSTPRGIVGVINAEVPGVRVALRTEDGHPLVGQATAARPGSRQVRVAVPGPDGRPWAVLVARLAVWSPSWAEVVQTILRLARAPLAASIAKSRLLLAQQAARERLLLERLLGRGAGARAEAGVAAEAQDFEDAEQAAAELGWRLDGGQLAVFLRPVAEDADVEAATPGVLASWREAFPEQPLVPLGRGWMSWWAREQADCAEVAATLRRGLHRLTGPVPLAAGVGARGEALDGLRRSLGEAELAAAMAVRGGAATVELFEELGPRVVLACLPTAEVAAVAEVALAGLIEGADGPALVATLGALLDCGGSTGQAAERLGLHRNTVRARLERIRAAGIDLDAPEQRLAVHLASYAWLNAAVQ